MLVRNLPETLKALHLRGARLAGWSEAVQVNEYWRTLIGGLDSGRMTHPTFGMIHVCLEPLAKPLPSIATESWLYSANC